MIEWTGQFPKERLFPSSPDFGGCPCREDSQHPWPVGSDRHQRHEARCDPSTVCLLSPVDCILVISHTWKIRVHEWALSSSLRRNQEWLWRWWSLFFVKGLFETTRPLRNSVAAVAREMRRMRQGEGTVSVFDSLLPRAQWPEWRQRGPVWPPSPVPRSA